MEVNAKDLRKRQNRVCYNWGFQFSLWCALLWGTCYQLLEILLSGEGFPVSPGQEREALAMGTVLALYLTVLIAGITLLWVGFTGDIRELFQSAFASKKIVLCLFTEAVVGGAAAWATYVTAGLLNTLFAVIGVMFYPVLGSLLARKWLREKVSRKIQAGMGILLAGWVIFYLGAFVNERWGENIWIGYLLGILTGIGWGIEGAVASYLTDLLETDSAVAIRFSLEGLLWFLVFLGIRIFKPDSLILDYTKELSSDPKAWILLVVIALCLTFNYFSWYRAFTLIGVTKGLVISDASGFVTVGASMLFAVSMPVWMDILASMVMVGGIFWIYRYGIGEIGPYREKGDSPYKGPLVMSVRGEKAPIKMRLLEYVLLNGSVWDYEVANWFSQDLINVRKKYHFRNKIRTYLIELYAAGMVTSIEDVSDNVGYFQKGKLLSKYQLTQYGYERLMENHEL